MFDEVCVALGRRGAAPIEDFFGRTDIGCDQDILHYLTRASSLDMAATTLEMDSRAYLIALAIARAVALKPPPNGLARVKALDRRRIAAAVAFIEDRLNDQPNLQDIAGHVGLSAFHFARAFKAAVGETPAAYVGRRQAERAREMIAHTKLPLAEIAARTGYSSQSHMSRRLKAIFGGTPGRLRNGDA
jgi:AraC family transcriptional regulator